MSSMLINGESGNSVSIRSDRGGQLYGVAIKSNISASNSIINAHANGSSFNNESCGLYCATLTTTNTDLFLSGNTASANMRNNPSIDSNYRECYGYQGTQKYPDVKPTMEAFRGLHEIVVMYGYDVIFTADDYGVIGFEKLSTNKYTVTAYTGLASAGWEFDHWVDEDGNTVDVDSVVTVDDILYLNAVFKETSPLPEPESSGSDNAPIVIGAVACAGIGIGAVVIYLWTRPF